MHAEVYVMENRKVLADKTVGLKPSGIRKFFDLVSEMNYAPDGSIISG